MRAVAIAVEQRRRLARVFPPWTWLDALVLAWLWWGFDVVNNLGGTVRQRLSESHGATLLRVERALHAAPEHTLNTWLGAHHLLRDVVAAWYENVHTLLTCILLVLLWWRRAAVLPALRLAMIATSIPAIAIFWAWPVAPPRMLPGEAFLDLSDLARGGAGWRAGATAALPDQLSAFPSIHVAWSVWSAVAIWGLTRRRWLRALAIAHPFVTAYAVMATGNHYLADVVAGSALMVAGIVAADRLVAARRDAEAAPRRASAP
jgi:hypothetical protein